MSGFTLRLAAVLAGAAVLVPVSAATAESKPGRYVSIGDSYTSGPLVGAPTGTDGCFQTDGNYPHLVAPALAPASHADVSCGSAETRHVFEPQPVNNGLGANPPQLDAVSRDTTVVSVGLGGNDIGFGEIIQKCVSPLPAGTPCQDYYVRDGVDELARRVAATAPRIDRVLDAVRGKAPSAKVYLVGYPSVVPDSGKGCWPVVPVTDADLVYLRSVLKRLNAMLAAEAKANGVSYVDTYTPGIGKDVCALPTVRWIEGLVPVNPATPFHPNARGERGMADAVLATMLRTGAA